MLPYTGISSPHLIECLISGFNIDELPRDKARGALCNTKITIGGGLLSKTLDMKHV
jgi:hypothetical protein